jgi:hypothetical protein
MNPMGAFMIVQAIDEERRRLFERPSRRGRDHAVDVPAPTARPSWRNVLRFRPLEAADSLG